MPLTRVGRVVPAPETEAQASCPRTASTAEMWFRELLERYWEGPAAYVQDLRDYCDRAALSLVNSQEASHLYCVSRH